MYELLISMQKYYGSQTSGANKIVRASMDIRSAGETTVVPGFHVTTIAPYHNALRDSKYTTQKFHYRFSCAYVLYAHIIYMYTRCWITLTQQKCLHSSSIILIDK